MNKIIVEHSNSIEELYRLVELTEFYLRDIDRRICELEKSKEYNEDYRY